MSAVELPHVPSARAPSSALSSSRRSLHSAGSTASYTSAKSLQRSYGGEEEDEDEEEEEEEEEEEAEEEEEEEEPHESSTGSGGLWDEVESFLNKPSPSFVGLAKDGGTKSTGPSAGVRGVLPTLKGTERKQPVAPSVGGGNQSGPRSTRVARVAVKQSASSGGTKAIDPRLLQEAFAYAEKIQKASFDDDEEDDHGEMDQQREADRRSGGVGLLRRDSSFGATASGPRGPSELKKQSSGSGSLRGKPEDKVIKKKSKAGVIKTSAYGASVKPQPTKKKSSTSGERRPGKDASSDWDASPVSSADPNGDGATQSRKGSMSSSSALDQQTLQSLVSNLQNGTALEELRRELAASQQSMAMSRQVIQDAAKSFFHTKK